jgi:hypothetical protein
MNDVAASEGDLFGEGALELDSLCEWGLQQR